MSLINKLEGIWKGDFIELSNTEGCVGGYVVRHKATKITLSHQDPVKEEKWYRNKPWKELRPLLLNLRRALSPKGYKIFSGDRTYKLKDFDKYKVLQKTKR